MRASIITKDLIAQHNLANDEYEKILGVFAIWWEIEP